MTFDIFESLVIFSWSNSKLLPTRILFIKEYLNKLSQSSFPVLNSSLYLGKKDLKDVKIERWYVSF